ncbi:MAG: 3-phosphoshikimate 1-carboxyvinyltransferase, partial [Candidatus Omnitrophica bacterium]|nr:3-phosphoshikimate 1-carboxyvinyltransferase [Candidatus Omnitrophota bacterium]
MKSSVLLSEHPRTLQGFYRPPGDKSVSHRAVMFGALSSGRSEYSNFLQAEDCLHTLEAFQS